MLHQLNVADGEEIASPSKFMPPNGKPYALNLFNNMIYTHTAQGCGGNPNVAYVYDLATKKVGTWGPAGGGMWGRTGPAISANGTMYTGTGDGRWDPENGIYGNGIVGLKPDPKTKSLLLEDYYGPSNAEWLVKRDLDMQVTPAIFNYKGKELMVDAGKECRVYLMDTASIGGDDHRTPLYRTPLICNEEVNYSSAGIWGSMASWEDSKGTRWVLTPTWGPKHSAFKAPIENGKVTYGAIVAFKVEEKGGKLQLTPAWISRDMNHAEPPVIANGVVFAYGSGEDTDQSVARRRSGQYRRAAHSRFDARGAVRAGCADRQRAVVQRRSDHLLESLERAFRGQRPGLHQHVRRHAVQLRNQEVTAMKALPIRLPAGLILLASFAAAQASDLARRDIAEGFRAG